MTVQAHFWTWTTPVEELERGIDHCPGAWVENVTTTDRRYHGELSPVMFHLGRDPGETFPLTLDSAEYRQGSQPPGRGLFEELLAPAILCHKEPARASKAPY